MTGPMTSFLCASDKASDAFWRFRNKNGFAVRGVEQLRSIPFDKKPPLRINGHEVSVLHDTEFPSILEPRENDQVGMIAMFIPNGASGRPIGNLLYAGTRQRLPENETERPLSSPRMDLISCGTAFASATLDGKQDPVSFLMPASDRFVFANREKIIGLLVREGEVEESIREAHKQTMKRHGKGAYRKVWKRVLDSRLQNAILRSPRPRGLVCDILELRGFQVHMEWREALGGKICFIWIAEKSTPSEVFHSFLEAKGDAYEDWVEGRTFKVRFPDGEECCGLLGDLAVKDRLVDFWWETAPSHWLTGDA